MKKNLLLTIEYDGSCFHGWQKQPGVRTVQGHLEKTMSRLFEREILLAGTSRTDAGVHAYGQRATLEAELGIPTEKLALVVNNALCAAEGHESGRGGFAKAPVRILKAEEMPEGFHARFNCKSKRYIYRINDGMQAEIGPESMNSDTGSVIPGTSTSFKDMSLVFERNYTYHVKEKLDVNAMNEATRYLEGTHDFKSFEAAGGNPRESTVRTIMGAKIQRNLRNSCIEFHIRGDGFLYNMVRIITGTLVEIGQGKRIPSEMGDIIFAADRTKAGHTAPPGGLYLAEIYY